MLRKIYSLFSKTVTKDEKQETEMVQGHNNPAETGIISNAFESEHVQLGRFIISNTDETRFNIEGDFQLFARIIDDMRRNGGELVPLGTWSEYSVKLTSDSDGENVLSEGDLYDIFSTKFSTLRKMLDPWIGQVGMQRVSMEQVSAYKEFLENIDLCGLVGEDLFATVMVQNMLNTDLGSIMDISLMSGFLPFSAGEKYSILEIGGGYGRLAEALSNGTDSNLHYVLVDAVPASLMYAKEYLEKAFPQKRIGFYLDDPYDGTYDFYVLPPWHLNLISQTEFDLCINVESMQEMVQNHVDFYLALFDKQTKHNGFIYISNSRAYRFTGTWKFPDTWEMLFCHNTPRSWTNNHPALMFKKTNENHARRNRIIEGLHLLEIKDWDLRLENTCLKNEIAWRDNALKKRRKRLI